MTEIKHASVKTVLKQVDVWNVEVVQCRSWQHAWDAYDVYETPRRLVEVHQCMRCSALRHRSLNVRNGRPLTGWLARLPRGYAMPKGAGRITGDARYQLYLAAARRTKQIVQVSEDELRAELHALMSGKEQ